MRRGLRWGMLLVVLCVAVGVPTVAGPADTPCRANPDLVGRCVLVHGRLRAYNGNPTFRIWPVGSTRLLGVTGAHPGRAPIMPHDLGASFDRDIYADFTVCPFTQQVPGVMQRVCIEDATNRIGVTPPGREMTGR